MERKDIYILNKKNASEKCDNSLVIYNDIEAFVFKSLEKDILEYFDGSLSLYEISNILSDKYSNYNEKDFNNFVKELIENKVIIPKD